MRPPGHILFQRHFGALTEDRVSEHCFLQGPRVGLRGLRPADADGPYPGWLNDAEVCRFNSHHVFPYDRESALAFIAAVRNDPTQIVLAVTVNETHVGNIALQAISPINRSGELSILIGDKSYWGKGVGYEAGWLLMDHGFSALGLHRIGCGTTEENSGMRRLATKLGMSEEGRRRQAAWKLGSFVDVIEYGVLSSEFRARTTPLGQKS